MMNEIWYLRELRKMIKLLMTTCLVLFSNVLTYSQDHNNQLDLKKDIWNFSNRMSDYDTIIVNADLCICTGERFEKDIITKRNDTVFVQVLIDDDIDGKVDYGKRIYKYDINDTLNFENLYSSLQNHLIPNHQKSLIFQIIYNGVDTLNFYTYGLMDKLRVAGYLAQVKDKIYFDKDYYKPIPIPPKPVGLSDEEKIDSMIRDYFDNELERIINKED